MDMDKILKRANLIALKAVKQQRKEYLAKIRAEKARLRFLDELAALFQEMVKQSRSDRLSSLKLTPPPRKMVSRDGKLYGR